MHINYQSECEKTIFKIQNNYPKLLLHSCCAPCSSYVLTYLKPHFNITVIYYNPNIYPKEEYLKRKNEQIRLLKLLNISFHDCDYDYSEFKKIATSFSNEKEGGNRCHLCYNLRLEKTALTASLNNYDFFGTTLTVSPYKNAKIINELGYILEEKYKVSFLPSDFKKKDGYKKSISFSYLYNLYRQDYCGCEYSLKSSLAYKASKLEKS